MNRTFRYGLCPLLAMFLVFAQLNPCQAADRGGKRAARAKAGQLPPHFADVVGDEQRDKLVSIHKDFAAKIQDAQKATKKAAQELKAAQQAVQQLKDEEQKKLEAELTAEQRTKLASLRAAAKERQAARKMQKGGRKAAQEKPSASS